MRDLSLFPVSLVGSQAARRNEDYREICLGLNPGGWAHGDILTRYDHCIWVGDLNYRLDFTARCRARERVETVVSALARGGCFRLNRQLRRQ